MTKEHNSIDYWQCTTLLKQCDYICSSSRLVNNFMHTVGLKSLLLSLSDLPLCSINLIEFSYLDSLSLVTFSV